MGEITNNYESFPNVRQAIDKLGGTEYGDLLELMGDKVSKLTPEKEFFPPFKAKFNNLINPIRAKLKLKQVLNKQD